MLVDDVHIDLKVKTVSVLGSTRGMLVRQDHIDTRRSSAEGIVRGHVPGHGGDVWWVSHGDEVGAYCFDEFDPILPQG